MGAVFLVKLTLHLRNFYGYSQEVVMKNHTIRISLLLLFILLWIIFSTLSIAKASTVQNELQLYSGRQTPVTVAIGEPVSLPIGTGDFVLRHAGEEESSGPIANWDSSLLAEMIENRLLKATVFIEQGEERLSVSPSLSTENGQLMLSFQPSHTYGTSSSDFSIRIRLTAIEPIYQGGKKDEYISHPVDTSENLIPILRQGEAFSSIIEFSAVYASILDYTAPLFISSKNITDGRVLADGGSLFQAAQEKGGESQLLFSLDGSNRYTAVFTFPPSQNQGDVNLFYTHTPIAAIHSAYPGISFYYLSFPGEPSFSASGSLAFPVLNGEDTVVYHWDSKGPVRMESVYDKGSKTVTVQGIRKLERYVVAPAPFEELFEMNPNMGGG